MMIRPTLILCLIFRVPLNAQSAQNIGRWTLGQSTRIGAVEGRDALAGVRAVVVSTRGEVYVAEQLVPQIRVYSSAGQLLRILGGRGSGPGEFQGIDDLRLFGDTLAVEDGSLQRVSFLSSGGRSLHSFRPASAGPYLTKGVFTDGSVLVRPATTRHQSQGAPPMPYMRLLVKPGAAAHIDTIALVNAHGSGACTGNRIRVCLGTEIGTADVVVADPHGRHLTVLSGLNSTGAERRSFDVTRLSRGGDTLMRSKVWYTPISVPRSYRDSVSNHWISILTNQPGNRPSLTRQEAVEVTGEGLQFPTYFPPVYGAVVSRTGDTWLQLHPRAVNRWMVLDSAGRRIADVVGGPSGLKLKYVNGDMAWGIVTDDLDVQYVVGMRIKR